MQAQQKVLMIDATSGFYRTERYRVGDFFGPVDLGLFLAGRHNSLNIGVGLLAGSIFPGSNRLVFSGFSPCWGGFYISSMGGAGLVFDNLGMNMISIVGKAPTPSILYLNRNHGEEVELEIRGVPLEDVWRSGRGGIYNLMQCALERYAGRYETEPRVLAVGPAAATTDIGAIGSAPVRKGELTFVDTWAGRGGFGTKMLQQHGIAAIIYGGTVVDEDFRDRKVADQWFEAKYKQKLSAKDLEATTKYRFDPKFETGGTFGVNYATLGAGMISFNYRSIYMTEEARLDIHKRFVIDHYLKQFNEETIAPKQQRTCGEPCVAVCKKMRGEFKKDYEPYQTMGPLIGVFDQRAAEDVNHKADSSGFDAISVGGVLAWLMECLVEGDLTPAELGAPSKPIFALEGFDVVETSRHNAAIAIALLDGILQKRPMLDLSEGARKLARHLARDRGRQILDRFLYTAYGRKGWMAPNQYWTPGVLSPMPIMGKYYMHYGQEFLAPRELGRANAKRFRQELILDNLGICRFHRGWAEEMAPEIMGELFDLKDAYVQNATITASRVVSRNSSVFWETQRSIDFVVSFLERRSLHGDKNPELAKWLSAFRSDPRETALSFWYDIHKGIHESLNEF